MTRSRLIALVVLTFVSAATADDVTATLEPVLGEPGEFFQPATLTVHNATDRTVDSLTIQWQLGGPTFVHAITVPPGESKDLAIALPAMTRHQQFRIDAALGAGAPSITEAEITWPSDWVDPSVWIDPQAYETYVPPKSIWPQRTRRTVWLASLIGCVLWMATAMIRHRGLRLVAGLVVLALSLAAVMRYTKNQDFSTIESFMRRDLLLLRARRTAGYAFSRPKAIPIYATRDQMMDDNLVYYADRFSVVVAPDRPRLFRGLDEPEP